MTSYSLVPVCLVAGHPDQTRISPAQLQVSFEPPFYDCRQQNLLTGQQLDYIEVEGERHKMKSWSSRGWNGLSLSF